MGYVIDGQSVFRRAGFRGLGALSAPPWWQESRYLVENPGVAAAIPGTFASGWDHWQKAGRLQRMYTSRAWIAAYDPAGAPAWWNEGRYLYENADVTSAVKAGSFASGWAHWSSKGRNENRATSRSWISQYEPDNRRLRNLVAQSQYDPNIVAQTIPPVSQPAATPSPAVAFSNPVQTDLVPAAARSLVVEDQDQATAPSTPAGEVQKVQAKRVPPAAAADSSSMSPVILIAAGVLLMLTMRK